MDTRDRPSGVSDLPQELVDHIVDQLKDDRASLRACTLVSRTLSLRSRPLLWRTVGIDATSVAPSSSFRAMLSAAPHICNAIHTLTIRGSRSFARELVYQWLVSLFDSLPNMHTIELSHLTCPELKGPILQWCRTRPLRELRFESLGLDSTGDLIAWVALFSKVPVGKLYVDLLPMKELRGLGEAELFEEWRLGEVEVSRLTSSFVLDIVGAAQVQHLHSLTLPQIQPSTMPACIRLSEAAGMHITRLRINLSLLRHESPPSSELIDTWAFLSSYSSLNTLEIDWNFMGRRDTTKSRSDCDHLVILQHISPTLQHLVFRFDSRALRAWIQHISEGPVANGRALETKLLSLPNLQSLTITGWAMYVTTDDYSMAEVAVVPVRASYVDVPVGGRFRTKIRQAFAILFKAGRLQFNEVNNVLFTSRLCWHHDVIILV